MTKHHKHPGTRPSHKDQLEQLLPNLHKTKMPANASAWLKDGVDHINITRGSDSKLGQMLSLDYARHWNHPILGPFQSLNTLWFFLRAKHKTDAIRDMHGNALKSFIERRCGGTAGFIANFRAVMMDSAYQRIKSCPEIAKALFESTLPFDCYRTIPESGIRIRFKHSLWFVGGYEEIRKALQEGRDPDFKLLMDNPKDAKETLYNGAVKALAPSATPEAIAEAEAALAASEAGKKKKKRPKQESGSRTGWIPTIRDIDTMPAAKSVPATEESSEQSSEELTVSADNTCDVETEVPVVEVALSPESPLSMEAVDEIASLMAKAVASSNPEPVESVATVHDESEGEVAATEHAAIPERYQVSAEEADVF